MHPRLMLFDEPLSNLDAKLRIEMRAEIKRIHASLGLTCIYVTHDQTEALSLSDWIVVMRDGVVMQAGPPQQIYDRPDNIFVADFMGFRNFFPGHVTAAEHDGQAEIAAGPLRLRGRGRAPLALGKPVTAAVRPEDVQVGVEMPGANRFRGKVEIVEYLGRDNEAVLTLEDGSSLWVRTPAHLNPGETVPVVFPPDKVLFLPGAETPPS
jgi:putative spermidine/putrescine transport system ATP-binding protein